MTRHGFVLVAALCGAGCGAPIPVPVPVSGAVTRDGSPLAEGTVYFKTVSTGAFEAFPVRDGKFEGKALPGDRRVEVTAYRVTRQNLGSGEADVQESLIPEKYNVNSTLTAAVTPTGPNVFRFEIDTK